jgi:perosamine synthetase
MNPSRSLAESILSALKQCLPTNDRPIALHEPSFSGNEWKYVKECLDSNWVSSAGPFVSRFEAMLCDFTGVRFAVATVNGTAALHICLKAAGVKPDDEVLCPTLTFVATANAIMYCNATPHFVDSDETTLGVDPKKLEEYLRLKATVRGGECHNTATGRRISALIVLHTFGHPADLDSLKEVCDRFKIALIEDAAQSIGSHYKGKHIGHWGITSGLSFNGNKTITTGGGGAILSNDKAVADYARHISTTARLPHQWTYFHDEIGYNYRLPSINAALGCAQLEELPSFLEKKRSLAERYRIAFQEVEGVRFFVEPPYARSNYWLNAILLDPKAGSRERDLLLELTNSNGVMTRPAYVLMHNLRMFRGCPRMDLSSAESIEARLVNIPSSPSLA